MMMTVRWRKKMRQQHAHVPVEDGVRELPLDTQAQHAGSKKDTTTTMQCQKYNFSSVCCFHLHAQAP